MSATSDIAPSVSSRWPRFLVIAIVVAATLGLRALNLNDPLWLDEMHTSWVVMDSFSDVAPRAAIGNQTPLYFWLNWLVVQVHESEISLRLVSYFAAGTLAGLIADTLWRWCEAAEVPPMGPALCAGLLFAIDPIFIFYGTEARPYALLQLVAFWRLRRLSLIGDAPTAWQRVGMIASGAALVWLHLTGGLIFAGELAALLVWQGQGRACYPVRRWLVDLAAIAAACLPLAWLAMFVFGRRQNFEGMVGSLSVMSIIEVLHIAELLWPSALIVFVAPLLDRLTCVGPAESGWFALITKSCRLCPALTSWAAAIIGVAIACHGVGIAPLLFGRYVLVAALGPPIVVSLFCMSRRHLASFGLACCVAYCFVQTSGWNNVARILGDERHPHLDGRRQRWGDQSRYPGLIHSPLFIEAGLIERDVSWKSPTALERAYATFPFVGFVPSWRNDTNCYGLASDWLSEDASPAFPPEALEEFGQGTLATILIRKPFGKVDAKAIEAALERETGFDCWINVTSDVYGSWSVVEVIRVPELK